MSFVCGADLESLKLELRQKGSHYANFENHLYAIYNDSDKILFLKGFHPTIQIISVNSMNE